MRMRTSGCSFDFDRQTTDHIGKRVSTTQWIPGPPCRKTYKTISKIIDKEKNMKIIGEDFNAELGPGVGIELSNVGHYTLIKANCRGDWMTQWLLEKNLVALNTMYNKTPQKQVTYKVAGNSWQTDGRTLWLEQ